MNKHKKIHILILLIFSIFFIKCSSTKFNKAFDKMIMFYDDPGNNIDDKYNNTIDEKIDFLSDFDAIISEDSLNQEVLSNYVYFLLAMNDVDALDKCNDYINRLVNTYPNNPLYDMLKFRLYEKIVKNYIFYGDTTLSSPVLFKTAIDSFIPYTNKLSIKYKDLHFVRLSILHYLNFNSFNEAEIYMAKTLQILESENYKKSLHKYFVNYIGYYVIDCIGVEDIPYIYEGIIKHYIHNFYSSISSTSIGHIREYYHLKILKPRKPKIELFPAKYHNYLRSLKNY